MRCFVAVIPPDDVIESLDEFLDTRRGERSKHGDSLRWVSSESFHLTLAFTESLPEARLDDACERLEAAATARRPTTATLGGGGAFPHAASGRLLYVGVRAGDPAALASLSTGARNALATSGARADGQRFTPHITAARSRVPVDLIAWLRLLDTYRSRAWPIEAISLVRSQLGQGAGGRSRYDVLAEFPLGTGDHSASP
jgi:2'-5' RNA ligase